MYNLNCSTVSPIHLNEGNNFLSNLIIFSDYLYFLDDSKFNQVLSRLGLLKDFILFSRKNNHKNTKQWLSKKSLLSSDFLETVSKYYIESNNIKKLKNFKPFLKDKYNFPYISENYLKTFFQNAVFYYFIAKNTIEFNIYAETLLNVVQKDLALIKDKELSQKREYYQKNFFTILIQTFLSNYQQKFSDSLEYINNLDIKNNSNINCSNLILYKVAALAGYKNSKFKKENLLEKECIKENTFIDLSISQKSFLNLKFSCNNILDLAQNFTSSKIELEKDYINSLFKRNNFRKISSKKNHYELNFANQNHLKNNYSIKLLPNNNFTHNEDDESEFEKIETAQELINKYFTGNLYSSLSGSNIFIDNKLDFSMLNSLLNLDNTNKEMLNSFIFNNKELTSNLVKMAFNSNDIPSMPMGYSIIDIY